MVNSTHSKLALFGKMVLEPRIVALWLLRKLVHRQTTQIRLYSTKAASLADSSPVFTNPPELASTLLQAWNRSKYGCSLNNRYLSQNGSFSSGTSMCPDKIPGQQGLANNSTSTTTDSQCPSADQ
ncbi:hypothetical protein QCA50_011387 [Cerrena zonata]|uniref:Uncharacterized protein n=1 Tax=Cerrena zonata TaxID=2478898 RepID=A0AAW0FX96_9APHY